MGNAKNIILIVDDNPKNIDMLVDMLAEIDCEIAVATSGEAALEILESVSPDLVLLDVQMPGMDGYQTCREIKKGEMFADVPVIFVTAKIDISSLQSGFEVGCVDYIRKPIQQEEVIARVRTHLRLRTLSKGLQFHNQQLSAILAAVMEGAFCVDKEGQIDCANPAALMQLGYTEEELLGSRLGSLIPDFGITTEEWSDSAVNVICIEGGGDYYSENHAFKRKSGELFPAEFTCAPLNDHNGDSFGAIVAFRDITDRKESDQRLVSLMSTDQLTGLVNWSEFSRKLAEAIASARSTGDEIVVYLLDIDDFRDVNDTLGHDTGDLLLTMVADKLREYFPKDGMITRLGGDEFALFRIYKRGTLNVDQEAAKILEAVNHSYTVLHNNIYISSSLGLVVKGELQFSADDMIRAADVAVYRAKEAGKNNYKIFTSEMQKKVMRRTRKVNNIRLALERGDFMPYFQPLINAETGEIIGAEGLARWLQDGYVVQPNEFIKESEDSGIIDQLSSHIYSASFAAASQWNDNGNEIYIAVNVSAKQIRNRDFADNLIKLIDSHGLDANMLVLEVTESLFMHDIDTVTHVFAKLRQQGVRIAIDDFGTGFSSLSYLTRIRADILKIDRSFVQDIGVVKAQETIVRTIITMAHSLNMLVVAEGVETKDQVSYLREHGCDIFQGYYYSKPVDEDHFNMLLDDDEFSSEEKDLK